MTAMTHAHIRPKIELRFCVVIGVLSLVTIIRVVGLMFSEVELFMDEAQYWSWSRELAWGYFSKPPLLAWIIHQAELICGSGEPCIRAPSPIFYFATSIIVYLAARRLYGTAVGLWATLLMTFGTGLVFSSRIISTDVPLAFFWALALLAYVELLQRQNWSWSIMLGLSLGLGLLAKYAMIYFLLGMLVAAAIDRKAHAVLRNNSVWLAMAIAAIIVAPNLLWVLRHDWVTFRNISATMVTDAGIGFNPLPAVEFLATQFAVFGPIVFATLLYATVKMRSLEEIIPGSKVLLAFAIPPLAIITAVALFTRVYAHWGAISGVSSTILTAAILVRHKAWSCLALGLLIGLAAQAAALFCDAMATRVAIPLVPPGRSDIYSRTLGFRALAGQVGDFAARVGASTIVGEERRTISALLYYGRNQRQQVLAWPSADIPLYDLTRPLTESAPEPILFVTECPFPRRLLAQYSSVQQVGDILAQTGPTSYRYHAVFKLGGVKGVPTALPKCVRE
jgi:4-amino-4-deoxy-L-arabinose transferase-like glycosyltransferase